MVDNGGGRSTFDIQPDVYDGVSEGAGTGVSLLPDSPTSEVATLTLTMADGSRQVTGIQFSSTEVIEATVIVVLEDGTTAVDKVCIITMHLVILLHVADM